LTKFQYGKRKRLNEDKLNTSNSNECQKNVSDIMLITLLKF